MPVELWTEVHNTVQEALTKTIPKKKKCRKKNMISLIHGIFKNQPNKHLDTD